MTFGLYTWKFHDRTQICMCAPRVFVCLLLHKTQRNMILASRGARRRPLCRAGAPCQGTHFWYVEKMGGARTWGTLGVFFLTKSYGLCCFRPQGPTQHSHVHSLGVWLVHSLWADQQWTVGSRYFPVPLLRGLERRVIVPVEGLSESEQSVKPSGHLPSAALSD